jgi:hypothetical protein
LAKILDGTSEMWYVFHHFFSFINFVHMHYILVQLCTLKLWLVMSNITCSFHIFIVIGHWANMTNDHSLKWIFRKHLMW